MHTVKQTITKSIAANQHHYSNSESYVSANLLIIFPTKNTSGFTWVNMHGNKKKTTLTDNEGLKKHTGVVGRENIKCISIFIQMLKC